MAEDKKSSEDFNNAVNLFNNGSLQSPLKDEAFGVGGAAYPSGYSKDYWNTMRHDGRSHRHEFDQRDPNRVREVFPSDDKGSPVILVFIMIGMVMGSISVLVAMNMGLKLLPLLAVYCSVGSAVTLGSAVVFALLKTETCGPETVKK